ncbi:MAG: hypothetical protein DHS20C12_13240 [Pseudohongiella sp.]|nr:MAG: hypothetical protein DHS20C12_13240 [Pseudohongiella sp.]
MLNTNYILRINPKTYSLGFLVVAVCLVSTHLALYLYNYQVEELEWLLLQLFDLDEENNLPTWFSSFLLLNNAFFLALVARFPDAHDRLQWTLMSAGFFILAIDEVAGLHETFNSSIETNWAIFGAILVLVVGAAFIPFLLRLRRGLALMFIVSGVIFVSGAIIIELLSEDMDSDSLAYMMAVSLEEGLEMLGAWLFLTTLLKEMSAGKDLNVGVAVGDFSD